MAFSDDMIARLGLNTSPFRRGLQGAKGAAKEFGEHWSRGMNKLGANMVKALGVGMIIRGFHELIDSAKKARETGEEFGDGRWLSATTVSVLVGLSDVLKSIKNTLFEIAGYAIGEVGKFFRLLGAFSVTGNLSESQKILDQMEKQDKKALLVARDKKRAEEDLTKEKKAQLKLEDKKAELLKKQTELMKQLREAGEADRKAIQTFEESKRARGKFTLQELASSPFIFTGRLEQERKTAKQVIAIEDRAEFLRQRGFGDVALKLRNRADELREGLTNVIDEDRFTFKSLEEGIWKSEEHLAEVAQAAMKTGIKIIPLNGP